MAGIRELNDAFRASLQGGRVVKTSGVDALDPETQADVFLKVRHFKDFNDDNDPYGEHDFGTVEISGQSFFWKIDYYNREMTAGSENPADPEQTTRVLTIMLSQEY